MPPPSDLCCDTPDTSSWTCCNLSTASCTGKSGWVCLRSPSVQAVQGANQGSPRITKKRRTSSRNRILVEAQASETGRLSPSGSTKNIRTGSEHGAMNEQPSLGPSDIGHAAGTDKGISNAGSGLWQKLGKQLSLVLTTGALEGGVPPYISPKSRFHRTSSRTDLLHVAEETRPISLDVAGHDEGNLLSLSCRIS